MAMEFSSTQLHNCLRDYTAFRDYFNKFCCLPVFGQRVTFMSRRLKFVFDPPPLRNIQSYYKVPNSFVRDWLMMERLPLFSKSRVASEFHLIQALQQIKYNKEVVARKVINYMPYTTVNKVFCILDDLKARHFVKVRHMRRFMDLVRTSSADANIISFWMETDRLCNCETSKRAGKLRKLQAKYFMNKSSYCLPYYILAKVYPEGNNFDQHAFDLHRIIRLQGVILLRLHNYWLPRYLVSRRNVSRDEKTFLRKMEILISMDLEEDMMQSAFDKCPYVRKIRDPEASIKMAAKKALNNKEFVVVADDDEENILVTEEQKEEIWDDEATGAKKKVDEVAGADLLGSEDVAFIHDHIFGSDHLMEKEKKSKKGRTKKKKHHKGNEDEYVLFPGKTIVVKKNDSATSQSIASSKAGRNKMPPSKKKKNRCKKALSQIRESKSTQIQEHENLILEEINVVEKTAAARSMKNVTSHSKEKLPPIRQDQPFDPTAPRKSKSDTSHVAMKRQIAKKSCSAIMDTPKNKEKRKLSLLDTKIQSKKGLQPEAHTSTSDDSSSECSSSTEEESTGSWESFYTERTLLQTSDSSQSTSLISNLTTETASTWKDKFERRDVREEYLRSVEPDMKLRDILASDKIAGYPFRDFLTKNSELVSIEAHGKPGRNHKAHPKVQLTTVYDIWREIETFRTTYFSMHSHELREKYSAFLDTFASQKTSPFYKACKVKIINDQPFPNQLNMLQSKLEELLEAQWTKFAIDEQTTFRYTVVTTDKATFKPRYSFPNSLTEIRANPVLQKPLLTHPPQYVYDEFEALVKSGNLGSLGSEGIGHMRYRVSRSHRLFMNSMGLDLSKDDRFEEFVGDESSDEEGGIPPVKPKVYVRLPVLDPKEVAKRSAVEYPRRGIDYKQCVVLRMRTQQRLEGQPLYMRPVKKHGVVLVRPEQKPKCLDDVLRDPLHYEFFKRYMKMHNSEAPLLFWKSVELLKRTDNPMARQKKAQQILKKFFSRVAGGGIMLQCESEIIKEVAAVDTVTTSMLVQTSIDVFKSMENNWAERYFHTFPEEAEEEQEEEPVMKNLNVDAITTSRAWTLFSEHMRKIARFLKSMREPRLYEEFSNYLKNIPERPHSTLAGGGDASSTALLFQKYETVMYKHMNTDLEIRHRTKTINGKTVTLNFLVNDLAFWMENDRYVALCDNAKTLKESGCFSPEDKGIIKEKRETIVKCYLESYVPPKIRVNMNSELADQIVYEATAFGIINRSVFHPAVMEVFPNLIHHWHKFCHEKYAYISKQTTKRNRHAMVEERRLEIEKRTKEKREKLAKIPQSQVSKESLSSAKTWLSRRYFPDYVNDLTLRPTDKVKGLLYSDPPTLHFSIEQGLKLILPPRRRIVERLNNDELETFSEEDHFLKVWTRGAKVVNVFRQGSDPRLVNLGDERRRFKVKCDMIEG